MMVMSLFFQEAQSADVRQEKNALSGMGALKSTILFAAKDSVVYNLYRRSMELWGKARIKQDETSVKAPKIVIDFDRSLLHAFGSTDSSKALADSAVFTDRQGSFHAETMTYNFKSRRGETSRVSSSSNGINFTGAHVSRLENGDMIVKDGIFTTCNEADPHYWFSSSSIVIKADSGVTAKPLVMYIRPELFSMRLPAIPVLALPWIKFPTKSSRTSGLLTPHLSSQDQSLYLSNIGYFWAIDDYSDLRTEGDISLNGNWRLGERFRYKKRDIFAGEISSEYRRYFDNSDHQQYTDWNTKILHNEAFDPTSRLDANLQLQGGKRYYYQNTVNVETILAEQANSYASYAKTFNNESGIANINYNHSDDLRSPNDRQTLSASFYQNRLYPFRSSSSLDRKDWKSALSVTTAASVAGEYVSQGDLSASGYSFYANGELGYYREFADGYKALFTQAISVQGMQPVSGGVYDNNYSGMRVLFPLRLQSTLFHYLNINPALTYMHSLRTDGQDDGFSTAVLSVDARTRLYGDLNTGFLGHVFGMKAVRHTFIPVIAYAWNPAYSGTGSDASWSKFYNWDEPFLVNNFDETRYSGVPEGQSTVGITLKNLFHGKFSAPSAHGEEGVSVGEHTRQLLSLTASTAYNFAAASFPLSPLTVMGSSNVLTPNLLFSSGAMYDFYSYDPVSGERIDLLNKDVGDGLLRFAKGFVNMSMILHGGRASGIPASTSAASFSPNNSQSLFRDHFRTRDFNATDYGLPWQLSFSLFLQSDRRNPLKTADEKLVNVSGRIALSKTWQTGINSGYDLQNKKLVYPMVQVYRDLDCWQMGFQWVPSGAFKSYSFQIGLKAL